MNSQPRKQFYAYYCYFYYYIRSNVTYLFVVNAWLNICAVILVLLHVAFTFSFHRILKCFHYVLVSNDKLKYDGCVANKYHQCVIWIVCFTLALVFQHFIFTFYEDFWNKVINRITTIDKAKYHQLQNSIQMTHSKLSKSTVEYLRETLDKLAYSHNDKVLLPVEIREIIVDMAHCQLPQCQKCGTIICKHIQNRYKNNKNRYKKELWRMKKGYITAKIMITVQLILVFSILAFFAFIIVFGFITCITLCIHNCFWFY